MCLKWFSEFLEGFCAVSGGFSSVFILLGGGWGSILFF